MTRQRTIKNPVSVEGVGLQTGQRVRLSLKSSPVNSGISFVRTDLPGSPAINLRSIDLTGSDPAERRTTLAFGPIQIQTTEHLLAAFSGLDIDNAIVELDNSELPGLDGSAKGFIDLLKKAGVAEQDEPKNYLKIDAPVWCSANDAVIAVLPDEEFRVSYTLSYNRPGLGTQFYSIAVNETNFEKEIAPARTFCLEEEAAALLAKGLGRGANHDNTLVLGPNGPIKTALRFPDEPARHKILDLIGDIYILGTRVIGHVIAIKSGHSLNMELVKKLNMIGRRQ